MKRNLIPLSFAMALLPAVTLPALGQTYYSTLQVPKQIQYQGRVATGTGGAWSGTEGYFVFALLTGEPGFETVLWNNWNGNSSPAALGAAYASPGSAQVLTLPVSQGVFSVRLGDPTVNIDANKEIPATVFFDTTSNSVRTGVKLAVWFSADGGTFTRLSPDVEFSSVPYSMVSGIAEAVKERSVTTAMLADGALETIKLGDSAVTTTKIADNTIQTADLAAAVAQALIPPGTILPYGGTTAPPGYLICAGQSYAKSTYPALAAALGNAFGGDASTFRIPDLRGRFLRGTDDPDGGGSSFFAAGRDPDGASRSSMNMGGSSGNAVGSVQGDQFKLHSHPGSSTNASRFTNTTPTPSGTGGYGAGWVTGTISITPEGGNETRPINAYVNFIIKL